VSGLRGIAAPFVAAAPAGARVRTRLRVAGADERVLRAVGSWLGSLAGRDLAARCHEGRLDVRGRAASRTVRKRALTAGSSSRWAGAITRTSEDAHQLAMRNLAAEQRSLSGRIRRIETRLAAPVGGRDGRVRGYATAAERQAKTARLDVLRARLTRVQQRLDAGVPSVCRGGKALLHKRNNLATAGKSGAGLSTEQWRGQWQAARLFVTADGEKDKAWGNETIRWHPDQGWLEIKLPAPLSHLANRPHGRYRLCGSVAFGYRGDEVAAQAATGAIRYDISFDAGRGRWYLDASWKTAPIPPPTLDQLRQASVVAVDLNVGHLAVAGLDPHGNSIGTRKPSRWTLPDCHRRPATGACVPRSPPSWLPPTAAAPTPLSSRNSTSPPPAPRAANTPTTDPTAAGADVRSAGRWPASPPRSSVTG
jgi:hypothetical protein